MLSIPAFIFSRSWLLIAGLFGFEIFLIIYYVFKSKNKVSLEESTEDKQAIDMLFDEEIIEDESLIEQINDFEIDKSFESHEEIEQINLNTEITAPNSEETYIEEVDVKDPVLLHAEQEFDQLWKEAINHVKNANSKKKAGESVDLNDEEQEIELDVQTKNDSTRDDSVEKNVSPLKFDIKSTSRAIIPKSKIKHKKNLGNYSMIKNEHREFYNELAINNWIYLNSKDRERVGLYKIALDETRFREKDIMYLVENGIIHKFTIPFPTDSFSVYSIYESEDKKIISNYLAKLCKQNNLKFNQKSIAFVNYAELGLERKNWRFDFYINNSIVGLIWISNFLIEDEQSSNYSIAFNNKKILKALLAASQISFPDRKLSALIIIDYNHNAREIKRYLRQVGYGQVQILAIGEKNFEKKLLKASKTEISV
jgi:hypothetical protein